MSYQSLRWMLRKQVLMGGCYWIEWRPKLQVWDAFRGQDATAGWGPARWASIPVLRTPCLLDAAAFVLSPHRKVGKTGF